MKHLCCSRLLLTLLLLCSSTFASLTDRSAMLYYGDNISYSMVGIHDYIIVNPAKINTITHGFSLYKQKMYAHIVIDENNSYKKEIKQRIKEGFVNFFFDVKSDKEESVASFIKEFHQKYAESKIVLKSNNGILQRVYSSVNAVLLESLLKSKISDKAIKKIHSHDLDIIGVEYLTISNIDDMSKGIIEKLQKKNIIPFVSNMDLDIYGKSSKNAIKREILTLIDESKEDRVTLSAHQHGAVVFEYLGYIQKLHNVKNGLPNIEKIRHYAGVVIWLSVDYEHPVKLIKWALDANKIGVKVVFADNFGSSMDQVLLRQLNITVLDAEKESLSKTITYADDMIGFEIEPSLSDDNLFLHPGNAKALLKYQDNNGYTSTPSAITQWGGYAIAESFMLELYGENIWIINPFEFFAQALRLKNLLVPDPTTENGNRLLFTHVDGDGIMNGYEPNPELLSGDVILEKILKVYKIPHSVSVIGAEINPEGLYPKLSSRLIKISQEMYKLENVESATHTFTHPFYWGKIKNDTLDLQYRLKVKNYDFSLQRELSQSIDEINTRLVPPNRPAAKTVFWSGDCAPRVNALSHIYKNSILNINGGDTTISNTNPWLSNIAPLGMEREDYYQIYTGAQNENVYTNDWIGPFWGFKRVVQTFKLTNSPRRLKPIDIYYHLYSGSKIASLNALKYVFNWAIKQDVMPIYTSEYIPKVMDFYTLSLANKGDEWLIDGAKNLKTLRIEQKNASVNLEKSKSVLGLRGFENHTYIALDTNTKHLITTGVNTQNSAYLIASNAKVVEFKNGVQDKRYKLKGHVELKVSMSIPEGCSLTSSPKASHITKTKDSMTMQYKYVKEATLNVSCR